MHKNRVVITGASGFIGRQLVPRLAVDAEQILLVGRDPTKLAELFPDCESCNYNEISDRALNFDMLIHLAVLNNDSKVEVSEFDRVNVGLLQEVIGYALDAHIKKFVNVTSFHAVNEIENPYAESKRKALKVVDSTKGIETVNLFLPAVYGDNYEGRLSVLEKLPGPLRGTALKFLSAMAPTVHVNLIAEFFNNTNTLEDRDVFLANSQDDNFIFRAGKMLLDGLFVFGVVCLLWWLLLILWIIIPFGSKGPGIFAQQRIGKKTELFTCYKFRSMKQGTKQAGTHELTAASVTKIGAFLRKTKLDEFPQVYNIIRGELSLVGPRPGLPIQTQLTEERQRRGIYSIRPGITGLAQINYIDMSDPVKLARWDARYIAQRSLISEIKIVIATILGSGSGDKVRN